MRHVILTCKNHPDLRWSCKSIAMDENAKPGSPARYNGSRSIFFNGTPTGKGMYSDGSGLDCTEVDELSGRLVKECSCPNGELIIAEEDALVRREPVLPVNAEEQEEVDPADPTIVVELMGMLSSPGHSILEVVRHLRRRTGLSLFEAYRMVTKLRPIKDNHQQDPNPCVNISILKR